MNTTNEDDMEVIVESPCTDRCLMDEKGICMSCFRSSEEIERWFQSSNKERLAFLKNAYRRQKEKLPK